VLPDAGELGPGPVLRRYMTSGYCNKLSGDGLDAFQTRRLAVYELLVGLLVRNLDEDVHVFALVVLSLLLLKNRTSMEIWGILNKLRASYSYTFTRELATDLGRRAMSVASIPADSSAIIMIGVYDNCMYSFGTSNEHIDEAHCNDNYQTINLMTAALPGDFDEKLRDELRKSTAWNDSGSALRVVDALMDYGRHSTYTDECWVFFMGIAALKAPGDIVWDIILHPDYKPPRGATPFVYQKHVPTMYGTARYDDNQAALSRLNGHVLGAGRSLAFVYGDQQTYSRMVWLKRKEPVGNEWFIPLPGDFHFTIHLLMAIHRLWWPTLIKWLVTDVGFCAKSCNEEKWDSVEKYNNYRFMYETLIVAIVTYFRGFLSKSHILNHSLLRRLTE